MAKIKPIPAVTAGNSAAIPEAAGGGIASEKKVGHTTGSPPAADERGQLTVTGELSMASDEGRGAGIGLRPDPRVLDLAQHGGFPPIETVDDRTIPKWTPPGTSTAIPVPDTVQAKLRRQRFQAVLDRHRVKGGGQGDPKKLRLKLEALDQKDLEIGEDDNLVLILVEDRLLKEIPEQIEPPSGQVKTPGSFFHSAYNHYYASFKPDLKDALRLFRNDISDTPSDFYAVEKDRTNAPYRLRGSVIKASVVYKDKHEDGLTVLAMRRLFQDLKKTYRNFRGVILVGAFPEALLMRRWQTGTQGWSLAPEGSPYHEQYGGGAKLGHIAEEVHAFRSDIVLADLDGRWDEIYHPGRRTFYMSTADGSNLGGKAKGYANSPLGQDQVEDFFFIDEVDEKSPQHFRDPEIGERDIVGEWWDSSQKRYRPHFHFTDPDGSTQFGHRSLLYRSQPWGSNKEHQEVAGKKYEYYHQALKKGIWYSKRPQGIHSIRNPIATPDIIVSRINARHVALSIDPRWIQPASKKRWDWSLTTGDPCKAAQQAKKPGGTATFEYATLHDPYLERELLLDYFARNHAFKLKKRNRPSHPVLS